MPESTSQLQTLRASTADLLRGLDAAQWSDADVAAESLCRGWTRGHVLTHLARNADGIAATMRGALHGEVVPRYPDGWDARNADIEAGAGRTAAALVTDVRESAERLDRVLGAVHEAGAWDRPTENEHPAEHWLTRRWKEVEIHRVDLAGEYTPRHWPAQLVSAYLPDVLDELAERSERPVRITITADGSTVPELAGRTWTVDGAGAAAELSGPDWAVLAWATGRGAVVRDVLAEQPELADWQ
jgi:maleylpyruvate isomerase